MSNLVQKLQTMALDEETSTLSVLRMALLVSKKLKIDSIIEWINYELDGYPNSEKLPNYRKIKGLLVTKQINSWIQFHLFNANDVIDQINLQKVSNSISDIEGMLEDKSLKYYYLALEPQLLNILYKNFPTKPPLAIKINRSDLIQIRESIKTKILDWTLELDAEGIVGMAASGFNEKEISLAAEKGDTYITIIYGMDGSQVQIGSPQAIQQIDSESR